jgi:hypothetical protein
MIDKGQIEKYGGGKNTKYGKKRALCKVNDRVTEKVTDG